jgi:site-specific recombinase XerD
MLPVHVAKALRAHRTRQHRMRREAGMLWQDHRFLFTDGEGRPLQWKTLTRRHLRGLLDKAGLPQVSGYSLRHACVAAMVRRGVRLEALARQTGYTRIGTVLDSRGVSRS